MDQQDHAGDSHPDTAAQADRLSAQIIAGAPDGLAVFDRELKCVLWNPAMERLTGCRAPEVRGQVLSHLFPAWCAGDLPRRWQRALSGESVVLPDLPYPVSAPASPAPHWGAVRLSPWHDDQGRIAGVIASLRDISDRRRTEELLRAQERLYRSLAEASPNMIFVIGRDGTVQYVNTRAAEPFGLQPEDLLGKSREDLFRGDFAERSARNLQRAFQSGRPFRVEDMVQFPQGSMWLETWLAPIKNKAGEVISVAGFSRNITERRRAEIALQESERRIKALVDAAPYGAHAYELQPDGRLVFMGANRSADQILKLDHRQFVGRSLEEAFPELVGTEIPDAYRRVATHGEPFIREAVHYQSATINGTFEVNALQISPNRVGVFFRDITARKKQEATPERPPAGGGGK